MKFRFEEEYQRVVDMKPGDVAISVDREVIYICAWVPNTAKTDCHKAVIKLSKLTDQYVHKLDYTESVKILNPGDKFYFEK